MMTDELKFTERLACEVFVIDARIKNLTVIENMANYITENCGRFVSHGLGRFVFIVHLGKMFNYYDIEGTLHEYFPGSKFMCILETNDFDVLTSLQLEPYMYAD